MIMNPGMLLFGLFDSIVAFFFVYFLLRAKLGGSESKVVRIVSTIVGTIVLIVYFGLIVWFNTDVYTISHEMQMVIYLAPIVLSILMSILVWLCQPPKKKETAVEETATDEESSEQ